MSRSTVVIDGLSYYVEHELMPVVLLLVKILEAIQAQAKPPTTEELAP